jgi:hypothetical protein
MKTNRYVIRSVDVHLTKVDSIMPYSEYFADRAEHYRKLAEREPSERQAQYQLGLANLFLDMSCDMRLRELAVEPDSATSGNVLENRVRRSVG